MRQQAPAARQVMSVNARKPSLHHEQVVDDAVIAYVEWREECREVWNAYGSWASAPPEDVRRAHAAYRAALDREEAAAKVYAGLIKRVGHLVERGFDHPLASEVRFGRSA
jgi:hypothetical protein